MRHVDSPRGAPKLLTFAHPHSLPYFPSLLTVFTVPHQYEAVRAVAGIPPTWPAASDMPADQSSMSGVRMPKGCKLRGLQCSGGTRGVLLADDMGLGKTVESLAGAWLHRRILKADGKDVRTSPTVIVAPNHAVLQQWRRHIIMAGPDLSGDAGEFILMYEGGVHVRQRLFREHEHQTRWVLMTRHTLQSEMKHVFASVARRKKKGKGKGKAVAAAVEATSPLFPSVSSSTELVYALDVQYRSANNKVRRRERESGSESIGGETGLLGEREREREAEVCV